MSVTKKGWLVIAANAALAAVVLLMALAVPRSPYLIVVAPPWHSDSPVLRIIAEADGTIVENGRFDWIAIAHSNQSEFASRLMKRGALLVIDHALAAGCLRRNST
ncbi:hypothetical protein [Nitratireductor sp. XY-223]|uniref:hypothetical protein n=1 Tax=Nitratireductor sp. XY-223 TaxID=2561926 RepID=UPI0010AB16EA|nr:hypothetical protein [Nitratireductor sp. XY-223]